MTRARGLWAQARADLAQLDLRSVVALATAAVVLVLVQFRGKSNYWSKTEWVREGASGALQIDFRAQCAWAIFTFVSFAVIPFLIALVVLRMTPRQLGLNVKGFLRHLWIYIAMFAVMVPAIVWAASRADFQNTYPFPRLARIDSEAFWIWEGFYLLQFVALEAFFRGFLIFALERRFGLNAIFVMTIPYAMIHFSKPMPEAFGAIFAGWILGYMALKTRSFLGGILLHYLVALTMDLLATGRIG